MFLQNWPFSSKLLPKFGSESQIPPPPPEGGLEGRMVSLACLLKSASIGESFAPALFLPFLPCPLLSISLLLFSVGFRKGG